MVNVLILGATGFIGFPLATSLRRAGHIVHAVVRNETSPKALDLEKQEIITFKGDAKEGSTWSHKILEVDVVIDAADTMLGAGIFKTVLEAAKNRPKRAPKITFIYTSGLWVHGDSTVQVSDRSILPGPTASPQLVTTWRPDLEQEIISPATREILDPIVVRPGLVFGGASTIMSFYFNALLGAKKNGNSAQIQAKKEALVPTVHKDDLAEAYRLIVEKSSLLANVSYPIFDIGNPVESLYQIITSAARALDLTEERVQFVEPTDMLLAAMSTTVLASSERARDLVGWQPRHPSLTAGMGVYMRAFLAHQEK